MGLLGCEEEREKGGRGSRPRGVEVTGVERAGQKKLGQGKLCPGDGVPPRTRPPAPQSDAPRARKSGLGFNAAHVAAGWGAPRGEGWREGHAIQVPFCSPTPKLTATTGSGVHRAYWLGERACMVGGESGVTGRGE